MHRRSRCHPDDVRQGNDVGKIRVHVVNCQWVGDRADWKRYMSTLADRIYNDIYDMIYFNIF